MRPSSSSSDVFAGVLARGGVAEMVSGEAWLLAMLEFEAALARAQAQVGAITIEEANEIATVCQLDRFSVAEIGAGAAEIGNPAGAVVARLRTLTDAPVHKGATSQDAVDTAAMLVTKRALVPLLHDLRSAADAAAGLAKAHRDTPIIGRTLLQHAVPTTFGLKAAGWMHALDDAADALVRLPLAAQLGGPAGTMAGIADGVEGRGDGSAAGRADDAGATGGPSSAGETALAAAPGRPGNPAPADPRAALAVLTHLARDLGLDAPVLPWHTARGRIGELAGALGVAAGAIGKTAKDITLLAQNEVGEVREGRGGGSSSMTHKRNPIAAVSALGCALQAPGLVATLLAAMVQEHERAAGAWHSEWGPLTDLLTTTGSAAAWLRESLEGLTVDVERMKANLGDTPPDTGHAAFLTDRALEHR